MNFEVIFRLKGKELARYQFQTEAQVDFETGVTYAIEMLRQEHPEIDLLDDGMFLQVQKAGEDDV